VHSAMQLVGICVQLASIDKLLKKWIFKIEYWIINVRLRRINLINSRSEATATNIQSSIFIIQWKKRTPLNNGSGVYRLIASRLICELFWKLWADWFWLWQRLMLSSHGRPGYSYRFSTSLMAPDMQRNTSRMRILIRGCNPRIARWPDGKSRRCRNTHWQT
jgi:hypothetical protein